MNIKRCIECNKGYTGNPFPNGTCGCITGCTREQLNFEECRCPNCSPRPKPTQIPKTRQQRENEKENETMSSIARGLHRIAAALERRTESNHM